MPRILTLVGLLGLVCCGCRAEKSVPPPVTKSSPPPPVATPVKLSAKPVKANTPAKPRQNVTDSVEAPTSNDFLVGTPLGLEVMPPTEVPEQNLFQLIPPAKDSSTVQVKLEVPPPFQQQAQPPLGVKLPDGFKIPSEVEFNERGFPQRILCEGDGAEMVLLEAGVFTRGSQHGPENAQPQHLAFVASFYMDVTEVTLAQFQKYDQATQAEGSKLTRPSPPGNANSGGTLPAAKVLWKDAVSYAQHFGKALPTEAEWERAARGPNGHLYPWGNGRPIPAQPSLSTLLPVRSRPTDLTPSGLYDMAGNASEWTADWYSATTYQKDASENGTPIRNPQGPKRPDKLGDRVIRGSDGDWKLSTRRPANLRDSADHTGFRCILRITEAMEIEAR